MSIDLALECEVSANRRQGVFLGRYGRWVIRKGQSMSQMQDTFRESGWMHAHEMCYVWVRVVLGLWIVLLFDISLRSSRWSDVWINRPNKL